MHGADPPVQMRNMRNEKQGIKLGHENENKLPAVQEDPEEDCHIQINVR